MEFRSRLLLVAAALIALSIAACGDDDSPTGNTNDTTPPGVTSVTPVDAYHIDVAFSEQVTKSSAEDESNYTLVQIGPTLVAPRGAGTATRGSTLVTGATLKSDNKTVTLATGTTMAGFDFDLVVHNVSDVTGNKIGEAGADKGFSGSNTPDDTAPAVVSHAPLTDATNIAVNATVVVNFSESIESATASWTLAVGLKAVNLRTGGGVSYTPTIDGAKLTLTPNAPLAYNTSYALNVAGTDNAGNTGTNTMWTFTTGANNDHTPPTLVSTSPANLATYVNVDANLSATFSEPINPDPNFFNVELVPDVSGTTTWSNGGKTMTFDPTASLLTNQSYTLTIFPKGVYDLAGNGIVGFHTVTFTTAQYLASGSIAGTISGDAGTPAADPTGAEVIASDSSPFNGGGFHVFGNTKVAGNNTYSIPYLPDGEYYIVSAIDTNHDGDIDPSTGDAVGGYGVVAPADLSPDSIAVAGGAHVTGKNFALFDPSTASGTVTYTGAAKGDHPILVALFDTTGFSTTDEPVAGTAAYDFDHKWNVNSLEQEFPEDDYYVGAYMDLNGNDTFDPLTDPSGFYGGLPAPTAVHLAGGNDVTGINIQISDPIPGLVAPASVIWPKAAHNAAFQRMVEIVRQGQLQASR